MELLYGTAHVQCRTRDKISANQRDVASVLLVSIYCVSCRVILISTYSIASKFVSVTLCMSGTVYDRLIAACRGVFTEVSTMLKLVCSRTTILRL